MNENLELYKHIYKDSDMAIFTINKLLKDLKEKDNKIKGVIEDILKEYEKYYIESKEYLESNNTSLDENTPLSKMGASMGIKKEVKSDNSDASIAEVLIQGIAMGSLDMEKKITNYKKEVDKKELKFAEEFLKFQQKTINELKKYL